MYFGENLNYNIEIDLNNVLIQMLIRTEDFFKVLI
jgi:hypothetical protein